MNNIALRRKNIKLQFDESGGLIVTQEIVDLLIEDLSSCGIKLDLLEPKTILDKLNYLMLFDCNNTKTQCADKYAVREYCQKTLGKDICVPLLAVYDKAEEIEWDKLPQSFVLKCNHGSGMNIIVKDKNKINRTDCCRLLNLWLKDDFALRNSFEVQYHNIPRKVIVEKLLIDDNLKKSLFDYKFWCFNGEPKLYTINNGFGHGDIMYYNMDDSENNLYGIRNISHYIKPKQFLLMKDYATLLAKLFIFVRVDFYEVNNIVYLGEMTFTPGACKFKYKSNNENLYVGSLLNLS